jgi:hypothetical protein
MKSRARVLAGLAGALVVANVRAETLYVVDELIVSVSSTADEAGERVASIHSGDSVEVLDRRNAYAHVRLSSGTQGWVKASYLSSALPMQRQLAAQVAELDKLHAEVSRLQGETNAAHAAVPLARSSPSIRPPRPRITVPHSRVRFGSGRSAAACWASPAASPLAGACSTGAFAASTAVCASTDARRARQRPLQPTACAPLSILSTRNCSIAGGSGAGASPQHGPLRATFDIYNAGRARFAQEKLKIVGHVPGLIGMLCLDSRMMKRQGLPAATHEHNK